jgi:hypothetical protein
MARAVKDWLTGYLKYTVGSEPPIAYHTWVGLSCLAGALQRRVYLKWGFETIYPNLYVILVGPSGKARKGVALGIGKEILSSTSITLTSEAITREALIRTMKGAITNFQDISDGRIKFHCSVTCFSEELSVFLGQNDIRFLSNLTDWYDSKDRWTYETKGQGTDKLEGLCFNLLGATAPDWLQSMLPQEAVGGGFTSRVIFVVEDKKGKTVSKHVLTKEELSLRDALERDLEKVSQLSGQFQFDSEGEHAYTTWYEAEDKKLASGNMPVADERFSGYCERRSTHIRKMSMLLSISRGDDLTIRKDDFDRALAILRSAELKMYKTFGGLGSAQYGKITEQVLQYIHTHKITTRSNLMSKFRRDIDGGTLRVIEEVMTHMKVVEITRDLAKGEVSYEWVGGENAI